MRGNRDVHHDEIWTYVVRKLNSNLSVSRLLDNIRDIREQSNDKRPERSAPSTTSARTRPSQLLHQASD